MTSQQELCKTGVNDASAHHFVFCQSYTISHFFFFLGSTFTAMSNSICTGLVFVCSQVLIWVVTTFEVLFYSNVKWTCWDFSRLCPPWHLFDFDNCIRAANGNMTPIVYSVWTVPLFCVFAFLCHFRRDKQFSAPSPVMLTLLNGALLLSNTWQRCQAAIMEGPFIVSPSLMSLRSFI